jgi:regulator of sigma E protease
MLTLIVFLLVLSILILAHELGHFLAAKKSGIRVEEFGLGYPPRVLGKKIGETIYSINLLPIGGFVRLYGEELAESEKIKGSLAKRAFFSKSKKARTAVIGAGVLANFLLAVVVFSIAYSVLGIPTLTDRVRVVEVLPNSPAAEVGLLVEDLVLEVDGQVVSELDAFTRMVKDKKGQPVNLLVQREDGVFPIVVTPRQEVPEGEGPMGVVVSSMEMVHYPFWQMPFRGAVEGFKEAFLWTKLVVGGLGKMVIDLVTRGAVPKDVAGPIGILQITGSVAQGGVWMVIQFIGILSVNLAVINFLPFPALDGGRFMFVLYELVTRKRPKPAFERWVNATGMALLLLIMVLVTVNDLVRIWETSSVAARFRTLLP